jgi:TonB family protein
MSVVFHLLSLLVFHWNAPEASVPMPAPIELVDVPTPESLQKKVAAAKRPQIAESEKAKIEKLDPNARFLSDRNQIAEKQTRARQTDDFREHQGTGIRSSSRDKSAIPPTASENKRTQDATSNLDGIPLNPSPSAGVKRDWKTLSMKDLSMGNGLPMGATDDRLEGVAEGDQTVLSTREFQYYSYYHRIKQTLRQYWKPNVERRLAMIWGKGGKLKDGEMVTQLLVLLDQQGAVAKVSTVASSGFSDIDDAAVDAFHKASPFPNPPRGIIDRDGLVRIRWDFILKAQSGPAIQFRRPTGGGFPP